MEAENKWEAEAQSRIKLEVYVILYLYYKELFQLWRFFIYICYRVSPKKKFQRLTASWSRTNDLIIVIFNSLNREKANLNLEIFYFNFALFC